MSKKSTRTDESTVSVACHTVSANLEDMEERLVQYACMCEPHDAECS